MVRSTQGGILQEIAPFADKTHLLLNQSKWIEQLLRIKTTILNQEILLNCRPSSCRHRILESIFLIQTWTMTLTTAPEKASKISREEWSNPSSVKRIQSTKTMLTKCSQSIKTWTRIYRKGNSLLLGIIKAWIRHEFTKTKAFVSSPKKRHWTLEA